MAGCHRLLPISFVHTTFNNMMEGNGVMTDVWVTSKLGINADDELLALELFGPEKCAVVGVAVAMGGGGSDDDNNDAGEDRQKAAFDKIEKTSFQTVLNQKAQTGVPLLCRECNQPASDFACGIGRTVHLGEGSFIRERDIVIPLCRYEVDSACAVKAHRRVHHFTKISMGKWAFNAIPRKCSNCGVLEPPGVLYQYCSRCKIMQYCSEKCQAENWIAGHKKACHAPP